LFTKNHFIVLAFSIAALTFALTGCPSQSTSNGSGDSDHGHDHDHGDGHDHDHSAHGPHEGTILELGDEEYHAEWTRDDETGLVTVYVLDDDMSDAVPITAEQITISMLINDEPKAYQLLPVDRTDGDPPTASQFAITDPALAVALGVMEGTAASLIVEIEGQQYTALMEDHDHDH